MIIINDYYLGIKLTAKPPSLFNILSSSSLFIKKCTIALIENNMISTKVFVIMARCYGNGNRAVFSKADNEKR
jgi:hypothetical protein